MNIVVAIFITQNINAIEYTQCFLPVLQETASSLLLLSGGTLNPTHSITHHTQCFIKKTPFCFFHNSLK